MTRCTSTCCRTIATTAGRRIDELTAERDLAVSILRKLKGYGAEASTHTRGSSTWHFIDLPGPHIPGFPEPEQMDVTADEAALFDAITTEEPTP